MLEDGSAGNTLTQISNITGNYEATKYTNSKNMSFANAIFIRDTYKENINESYISLLTQKYNAELKYDTFTSPNTINSWVKDKTLGLIDNLLDDLSETDLVLINALAIDMDWEEKFILYPGNYAMGANYEHEKFFWGYPKQLSSITFENGEVVSGMEITASFNNYDIVKVLGEEHIRETVRKDLRAFIEEEDWYKNDIARENNVETENLTEEMIQVYINKYLDNFMVEINRNYGSYGQREIIYSGRAGG